MKLIAIVAAICALSQAAIAQAAIAQAAIAQTAEDALMNARLKNLCRGC